MTKKQAAASKKELTIVAVYKFKTNGKLNGTVCTLIRSSKVVKDETVVTEHKVWTHTNGCASHCDCDGFEKSHGKRQCGHIKLADAREAARKAATVATPVAPVVAQPQASAQPVIETTATKEAAPVAVVATQPMQEKHQADLDAESKRRMTSTLASNQGFSLLKKAS